MNKIQLLEFFMRFIAQGLNLIHTLLFSLQIIKQIFEEFWEDKRERTVILS